MNNLRNEVLESFKNGTFLKTVYTHFLAQRGQKDFLAAELASLHNEGKIDIIEGFVALSRKSEVGVDFFLTRRVFENSLPMIAAPVRAVMATVHRLYTEAGKDLAAGTVFDAYISFCEKDSSRPKEALKEIENNPSLLNLLTPTIIAGSRIDFSHYLNETLALTEHPSNEVRRNAVLALGRIQWPDGESPPEVAYAALEKAVTAGDDQLLGCVIRTSFSILQQDEHSVDRIVKLINTALSKGGDFTLHAASELIGYHTKELSKDIIDGIFQQLLRVKPANKATIENIDFGIEQLLETDRATRAIDFLQDYLTTHADEISLESFGNVVRYIRQNDAVMNKVSTRWFLGGKPILCKGVKTIVEAIHNADPQLEIDSFELRPADARHFIFVARKAIGYLFFKPISAASLIISLMNKAPDQQALSQLAALLFDPLLINYTGKVREYVAQRAATASNPVKQKLDQALSQVDNYLKSLRSIGEIVELHPSEAQRESYNRHFSREMAKSLKEAEAESVFLRFVSKQVLLYGRGAINYVYGTDGQANRQETPLKKHGVEFEVARQEQLDPVGLDYMLRVFRVEQFRA